MTQAIDQAGIAYNDWWEFYGLQSDPFEDDIPHNAYTISKEWEQHIDLLQLLARHSYELLILEGVIGSGKTSLCKQFLDRLDDTIPVAHILGHENVSPEEVIDTVNGCFDLTDIEQEDASIRQQMNQLIDAFIHKEKRCLLIIDDADQLPTPTLQALLYLQSQRWDNQAPLAIVLFSDKDFSERVVQLGENILQKGMLKVLNLQAFDLSGTQRYIEKRLDSAGLAGTPPLNRDDVIHIHKWSGGIPGRINNVAKNLLIENMDEQEVPQAQSSLRFHQNKVLGGAILVIIAFMALFVWQKQHTYPSKQQISLSIPDEKPKSETHVVQAGKPTLQQKQAAQLAQNIATQEQQSTPPAENQVAASDDNAPIDLVDHSKPSYKPSTNDKQQQVVQQVVQQQNNIQVAKATAQNNKTPVTQAAAPKQNSAQALPSQDKRQIAQTAPQQNSAQVLPSKDKTQIAKTTPLQNNAQISSTVPRHANNKVAVKATEDKAAKNVKLHQLLPVNKPALAQADIDMSPTTSNKTKLAHKKVAKHIASNSQYFQQLPKSDYTLQILGLSELTKLKHYISSHKLGSQARYYHTKLNGKDFYILLYGNYKNKQQAKLAMAKLPNAVRKENPWIRSISSVQRSIKKQ